MGLKKVLIFSEDISLFPFRLAMVGESTCNWWELLFMSHEERGLRGTEKGAEDIKSQESWLAVSR